MSEIRDVPEWVARNPRWSLAPLCDCGEAPGCRAPGAGWRSQRGAPAWMSRIAPDGRRLPSGARGGRRHGGLPRNDAPFAFATFRSFATQRGGAEYDGARTRRDAPPVGAKTCRQCGCREYGACRDDDTGPCWCVEADRRSHWAAAGVPMEPIFTFRARDWLRLHDLAFRDAMLLAHDDAGIVEIAREDMVRLTCPGDIRRERDAAVVRRAA